MKKPVALTAVALLLAGTLTACGPASRENCKPSAAPIVSVERAAHAAPLAAPPVIVPRPVIPAPRPAVPAPRPAPAPVRPAPAPAQTTHTSTFPFFLPFFLPSSGRC